MNCCNCRRDIADYSNFCYFCGVRQVQPTPPGHSPWQGKRLMRSSTDVKVAGVCAGFAEYLDWDVTLVRVLWAVLTIMPVPVLGIVAYAISWIVMPVAPLPVPQTAPEAAPHNATTA